ncbi:MAG: quinone-dependent dihydroorotate dehydrogenase [Bacteroidales bacterium]|nr:quinone-dependent dihydroorotate dehydrogenase [Bacteroidales bacterium]
MYKLIVRPVLFLFNPENVHGLLINLLKLLNIIPGMKALLRVFFMSNNEALKRTVFGIEFKNPVGLAAGFDKNAEVFDVLDGFGFSFVEIGTVTPLGQKGNPKPRLFRLKKDKAIINRMGFNNNGLVAAIKKLKKRKGKIIVGGNIGKNTATSNEDANNDYIKCFNGLHPYVDYFTVNVSCPNVCNLTELQDKDLLCDLLTSLKKINSEKTKQKPILLKISPDLSFPQIDDTLEIIKKTGIDGIVAVNTTTSRENLTYSDEHIKKIANGGLSGKPLKNRSTEIIKYISKKTKGKLPIIGVGGIINANDAIEKLNAGASLVQAYTGFIYEGASIVKKINKAIIKYANTSEKL